MLWHCNICTDTYATEKELYEQNISDGWTVMDPLFKRKQIYRTSIRKYRHRQYFKQPQIDSELHQNDKHFHGAVYNLEFEIL